VLNGAPSGKGCVCNVFAARLRDLIIFCLQGCVIAQWVALRNMCTEAVRGIFVA
jgi:hypothetical protein